MITQLIGLILLIIMVFFVGYYAGTLNTKVKGFKNDEIRRIN